MAPRRGQILHRPRAGADARPFADIENQDAAAPVSPQSRSRRRLVSYEHQDVETALTPALEFEEAVDDGSSAAGRAAAPTSPLAGQFLAPSGAAQHHQPEIGLGSSGKRAYVDGIAVPFRLKQDGGAAADSASMMTLNSEHSQWPQSPRVSAYFEAPGGAGVGGEERLSFAGGGGRHGWGERKEGGW